jgi:hypothetical protein
MAYQLTTFHVLVQPPTPRQRKVHVGTETVKMWNPVCQDSVSSWLAVRLSDLVVMERDDWI